MPLDAGMVAAKHRIAERSEGENGKPGQQQRAWRASGRANCHQRAKRDSQVIGIALLQTERTGQDSKYELEKPCSRQRRRGNNSDGQRRRQRWVAGEADLGRVSGGLHRHGALLFPKIARFLNAPIAPNRGLSRRP